MEAAWAAQEVEWEVAGSSPSFPCHSIHGQVSGCVRLFGLWRKASAVSSRLKLTIRSDLFAVGLTFLHMWCLWRPGGVQGVHRHVAGCRHHEGVGRLASRRLTSFSCVGKWMLIFAVRLWCFVLWTNVVRSGWLYESSIKFPLRHQRLEPNSSFWRSVRERCFMWQYYDHCVSMNFKMTLLCASNWEYVASSADCFICRLHQLFSSLLPAGINEGLVLLLLCRCRNTQHE